MKDHNNKLYSYDAPLKQNNNNNSNEAAKIIDVGKRTFDEPYVELCIWAIFTNKRPLIDFFWERCSRPILMAVVAAAIYSKLGFVYKNKLEQTKVLQERKVLFQERANELGWSP